MRRISIVAVIAVSVLALAGQLIAPRIAAREIEKRLTKGGGSAHAKVHAIPWPRLIFTEGDSVEVKANGIALPVISPNEPVLKDLDGFNRVDIQVTSSSVGPMEVTSLTLQRDGGPYELSVQGGVAVPFTGEKVPIDLQAVLRSDGGRPRTVTAHGTVAGFPAGPLVEALAQALVGRF
jgi:hypothetical protein